ncbi:hypothetical protein O181_040118 [Austropuccinia psidii MF-1]|uniref:Uncharacterized protein n=1 Tax=Austropuccinia psidii MF-1 TaxID=1389203 RepID=A0A9Q3DEQ4_9BASI|nr:hypothetical protein [Austropuccinia psidii MF-1]
MIQALEGIIRRFCDYGLELKESDGFDHDWCTLIPALELACKTLIHSSTGRKPSNLEKGWNPRLPYETPKKGLERWDRSNNQPDFKVGDLALVSTFSLNNIGRPKKLKNSFA